MRWLNQPVAPLSAGATRYREASATATYYWGVKKRKDVTDFITVSNPGWLVIIANCITVALGHGLSYTQPSLGVQN